MPERLNSGALDHKPSWPELPLAGWLDTYQTLHRYLQVIGKVRLALSPREVHWWQVAFYLTSTGMTTSPVPYGAGTFEVLFDFIHHQLKIQTSEGGESVLRLEPRPVADFYREVMAALGRLGVKVTINDRPVEIPGATTRLSEDVEHCAYAPEYVHRCWQVMMQTDILLKEFRSQFLGKMSPVHFFWGSFDLTLSLFPGRSVRLPSGTDAMTREAGFEEDASCGFWPGTPGRSDAAFFCYFAPLPPGLDQANIRPAASSFNPGFNQFLLPYEAVRTSQDPRKMVLEFFQSTYDAGSRLAGWDRSQMERAVDEQVARQPV